MPSQKVVIFGYGDIGQRIAIQLLDLGYPTEQIIAIGRSVDSSPNLGLNALQLDLDHAVTDLSLLRQAKLVYLVPPATWGAQDSRSRRLIAAMDEQKMQPAKVVLISTTGVYGDCGSEWVTEERPTNPQTERGKRRLDSESQWQIWSEANAANLTILRVPGIYAYSRLPLERLKRCTPVVRADECGYTNRIHADDLATVVLAAMNQRHGGEIINVADGTPGKISDYLQHAAAILGLPALPEISLAQAQQQLSPGMLSYLSESRRISNVKMLEQLKVTLRYPDYRIGMRH